MIGLNQLVAKSLNGVLFVCLGLCAFFAASPGRAQEESLDSIRRLRLERKFDLADKMISRLKDKLGPRDYSQNVLLQIELIKSKTARAFEEKSDLRSESYKSIVDSIDRFERLNQSNPNLILVAVQKAMTGLKFGELIRKEIEAGQLDSGELGKKQLDEAFGLLRIADRQFEELDKKLELKIPGAARRTSNGELNQRQLISLQNQVRYQRIKTKLNRGMLYGSSDLDNKTAVIMSARNDLIKVIPMIEKVDPSWWNARLDLLRCLREVGEFRTANKTLESFPVDEASPTMQLAFRAEALRLAIATKNLKQAQKIVGMGREIDGVFSADIDFANLEYKIFLIEHSSGDNLKAIRQDIGLTINAIESQYGAYWGRRAKLALVASLRSTGASGSRSMILLAQDYYRQKKYDDAILHFEKAAEAARKELNRKLELELRFQAIVIHRNLKQHDSVVKKSSAVARQFKDTNRAASVHLLGILSAAELVRAGQVEVTDYIKMLDAHLQNWKHHPTVGHVAMYRGDFDMANRDYVSAAIQFRNSIRAIVMVKGVIDLDGFEKSMIKLSAALKNWRRSNPRTREMNAFKDQFDGQPFFKLVLEKTSDLEASLNGWAIFTLEVDQAQVNDVFNKLSAESDPKGELLINLIRVAIRCGKLDQVEEHLNRLTQLKSKELTSLLQGLNTDWTTADTRQRKAIATCIEPLKLEESLESEYWQLVSESLIVSGNHGHAIKLLEKMVAEKPSSLTRNVALARALCSTADMEITARGLVEWRKILARSRDRSDSWYEAKYEIASCHLAMGNSEEAKSILEVMRSIPPGWSKSKMKDKFDQLFRKVAGKE